MAAHWLRRLSLLHGRTEDCRLCGKTQPAHSHSLTISGLCLACTACIPWVREVRCPVCGRPVECGDCVRRSDTAFVCNRSAVRYDAAMKALLARYKYRGSEALETTLAEMLLPAYRQLTREAAAYAGVPLGRAGDALHERRLAKASRCIWHAVTFVPVSAERAEERGFNQAERLASQLSARYRLPLLPLLARTRHSGKQSFKSRAERFRDMRSLFAPAPDGLELLRSLNRTRPPALSGDETRILLVDDIYTTGSTMNACARVLRNGVTGNALIFSLTWARS